MGTCGHVLWQVVPVWAVVLGKKGKKNLPVISLAVCGAVGRKEVGCVRQALLTVACWAGLYLLSMATSPCWNLLNFESLAPLCLDCREGKSSAVSMPQIDVHAYQGLSKLIQSNTGVRVLKGVI